MISGPDAALALKRAGVTHVVWIPDSELGTWESALSAPDGLPLIRVCREGEAFAVAAGLWLAGQSPLVVLQCTGLFEAGDSLRNILHDLRIPLTFLVGVRSQKAHAAGTSTDTCPVFAEPILDAWKIPCVWLEDPPSASALADAIESTRQSGGAGAILLAE